MHKTLPLIEEIARSTPNLEEFARELIRTGYIAYTTHIRLPKRHPRIGTRIRALAVYVGRHLEAIAVKADGLGAEDLKMLSDTLGVPVVAFDSNGARVYHASSA
ncbi:hypothetical protein Pyrfu_0036 [Pyrolobus fumarii 1A]|uniref:Uncharacterized protein n=1 Tax=Pyrolobus fumarii (strain DSM 11204 / 1A) TaxID=694429 RepID=G0EDZ2_PYRF1|nr:hypothetical protein [Pyrolobus fumarii]AEM37908.1 hypothetical protein Pyrfu_0036 [Pyrolobus fumarii 1A]